MYDWPEIRDATDRYWQAVANAVRATGLDAPDRLIRPTDPAAEWTHPGLFLSQTCGRPYATALTSRVVLIGIPAFFGTGAEPGRYHSVLVSRSGAPITTLKDLEGLRFAFNGRNSQSGFAAPVRLLIAEGAYSTPTPFETGGHRASIRAVAEGRADWAAIDVVSWLLALRHEPAAAALTVFAQTPDTVALPVVAGLPFVGEAGRLADAFGSAITALADTDRHALMLSDFVSATEAEYRGLAAPFDPRDALPGLAEAT